MRGNQKHIHSLNSIIAEIYEITKSDESLQASAPIYKTLFDKIRRYVEEDLKVKIEKFEMSDQYFEFLNAHRLSLSNMAQNRGSIELKTST